VVHDVEHGTLDLAVRSGVAVVVGAGALGFAVYRRPRRALTAGGLALALLAASGVSAYATWNPKSVLEPRFSGLLSSAPSVIGNARGAGAGRQRSRGRPRRALTAGGLALALLAASGVSAYATWNPKSVLEPRFSGLLSSAPSVIGNARGIVSDFDVYQQELARLVTNVTKLYDVTSTLPTYQPDPSTIRVLHVSDIHLNPASWKIIASLVKQYKVNVIVDSGDTMDHGTAAENGFLDPIAQLGVPYVWVRGNHDSRTTQRYLERMKNVRVLDDGRARTVGGLRFAGIGDPQFTPDRAVVPGGDAAERLAGDRLDSALRSQRAAGTPVDVAITHEPVAARETDGEVPLVLCGHLHHEGDEKLPYGTRLRMEGSTGGSGLRAVEGKYPAPIEASVLYFDRDSHRLQAWDAIRLGGLGLTTAEVSRHLADDNRPAVTPPSTAPSPSGNGGSARRP
ncbi:metallophosphoesterase family protein, partial [Streptomyces murinus]|uniref:metallophosphoesterase family protein n=1 Tax=Streptomyces murinus TaxID=33900 RepID=UPI001FC9B7EB